MDSNIIDFNKYKASKGSGKKNPPDPAFDFPVPSYEDMGMEEYSPDSYHAMLGAFSNLFTHVMDEASEYDTFEDYLAELEESLDALKEDIPKSKEGRKYFIWLSQLMSEEMTYHMAMSIGKIIEAGEDAINAKRELFYENKIKDSDLGLKFPIKTNDDVMLINHRVEEIMERERNGEATEEDIDKKTTLLTILVMMSEELLEDYFEHEPRSTRKTQYKKWETDVKSVHFNINCFYYLCGSSYKDPFDQELLQSSSQNDFLSNLSLEEGDAFPDLSEEEVYHFISSMLDHASGDGDYEDYDDDDFDFDEDDYDFDDDDDFDFDYDDDDDDDNDDDDDK